MSQLEIAHDLMRRLPPQNVEQNLLNVIDLVPDLTEDLLSTVDTPLKVQKCPVSGKDYLLCDYNRDGDSFRSPWSNQYDPPIADGAAPSDNLRKLEVATNDAFDTYRDLYYEGGISSVYMWDLEADERFAAVVLIKKVSDGDGNMKGSWDSIHVLEIQETGRKAHYKLTSTMMLYMVGSKPDIKELNLSGSLTRQVEQDYSLEDGGASSHIINIGRLVEEMENRLRNTLQSVYFEKTRDIVNDLRSSRSLNEANMQNMLQKELLMGLNNRNEKK